MVNIIYNEIANEIFFRLYPPLSNIQEISVQIAKKVFALIGFDCYNLKLMRAKLLKLKNMKVAEEAYEQNTASTYPEPEDKEAFIRTHLYDYNYDKVVSYIYFKSGMIPIIDLINPDQCLKTVLADRNL